MTYSLYHASVYIVSVFICENSLWDLFLPMACLRWLLTYLSSGDFFMIVVLYNIIWFYLTCIRFLRDQWYLIRNGITSFEYDNSIKIVSVKTVAGHIQGVFGDYWWLNFVIPLHWVFPVKDNGVTWDEIKM